MTSRMSKRACLSIVLAAGEGTRMRASRPKVLHAIAGRSLIEHVIEALRTIDGPIAVVVGPNQQPLRDAVQAIVPRATIFEQSERRGTAHAVLAARAAFADQRSDLLVAFADTPLITAATLRKLRDALTGDVVVAVLGFRAADPSGYGRLILEGGRLVAIREEKDATEIERKIDLCNAGLMALRGDVALQILDEIGDDNAKREFYLTDAVAVARGLKGDIAVVEAGEDDVRGVNTQMQLAEASDILQDRLRRAAMEAGVSMVAPQTVFLSADTKFGRDVVIEPHVVCGPGVVIGNGVTIRSFCHLEGARVDDDATVGPFARLRPGARIGADVRIGNFVEVKEAEVERGARINHLTYIGDARVGAGANVGAGTITCNFDGENKHRTDIGKDAFIGSNAALVAPVRIGDGAYVASGSVITEDVPDGALALGRARQMVKQGWVPRWLTARGKKPS
jgi:bifunctional UDP-N-acetylglucosamine pyrophosphorylase/glucosamine-1-phosphate N-acetyltransferase